MTNQNIVIFTPFFGLRVDGNFPTVKYDLGYHFEQLKKKKSARYVQY